MEWFKSNVEKIVEIYGANHNITREDLVLSKYNTIDEIINSELILHLVTGTLDTSDYALFVSTCHQEGSVCGIICKIYPATHYLQVTFSVNANPQIGQPWGAFFPTNSGQFTSKVSQHGGPWQTVLVSCLHI